MNQLENLLISIVALLHFYFLILEMFLWTKPIGLRIFNQTIERAKTTSTLAANQGLYNGFLALGLVWSLVHPSTEFATQLKYFFLGCVAIAGLFGGYSVNKRILVVQALPAAIAIIVMIVKNSF